MHQVVRKFSQEFIYERNESDLWELKDKVKKKSEKKVNKQRM